MIALFLIIVAAIIFAPLIKAVGKAGIFLLLILIGMGWIGSQFNGTTTARTVTTPTIQTVSSPAPEQSEAGSADKTSAPDDAAAGPSAISKNLPESGKSGPTATQGELVSHVEPGSATEWNEEDKKPDKKRGKGTRGAKAEVEPDATPTIREHVDEIVDAPSPKAALRAWADWMDELNEEDEALEAAELKADKAAEVAEAEYDDAVAEEE